MFRRMLIIIFLVFIKRNAFNLMSTFRMNKYNLFLLLRKVYLILLIIYLNTFPYMLLQKQILKRINKVMHVLDVLDVRVFQVSND